MDGFWMYSGEKSRGLANGLDVKERGIKKKKEESKLTIRHWF